MYHFQYISKSEIAPLKNQVIELIGLVQDEIRNYFTFQSDDIESNIPAIGDVFKEETTDSLSTM